MRFDRAYAHIWLTDRERDRGAEWSGIVDQYLDADGRGHRTALSDAERAAGREPTTSAKAIFGRKVKEIPSVDPLVMTDALARMTEEEKPPGTLALVYGDCVRAAEREVFAVETGGRARVR